MKTKLSILLLLGAATVFSACAPHPDPYVRHGRRTGVVAGAATGAIVGHNVRGMSKTEGALVGGLVGGLIGDQRGKTNSMYYRGY
jgi:uncharacterized protein YcfJ